MVVPVRKTGEIPSSQHALGEAVNSEHSHKQPEVVMCSQFLICRVDRMMRSHLDAVRQSK
jgi:hypothetical protein